MEVEVHAVSETPADDYDERCVEKGRLDGCAENVRQGEVHLIVPCFIDGCEVFCGFFDERYEDETHEANEELAHVSSMCGRLHLRVLDVVLDHNIVDLLHKEDGHKRNASNGDDQCENDFCEGELLLTQISVSIGVFAIVGVESIFVQAVVRAHLEEDEAGVVLLATCRVCGYYQTYQRYPKIRMIAVALLMFTTVFAFSPAPSDGMPVAALKAVVTIKPTTLAVSRGSGIHRKTSNILPATNIKLLPTSLTASWNSCSSLLIPPAKKQVPKHKSKLARMDPRMAALMMKICSLPRLMSTMKRMISTREPNVVSIMVPMT